MSSTPDLERVAAAAEAVLALPDGPLGVALGVATDAGTRVEAVGSADSSARAVTPGSRFDVASVTKVVATTSAIHRLASLGELDLDDEVSRYVPSSACAPGTTLSTLMLHRSGLWEWQPLYLARTPDGRREDPFAALDALPLRYEPGRQRAYSDLGFVYLGRVVSAVTGLALADAVAELVLQPVGLAHTGYGPVSGDVVASAPDEQIEREMVRTGVPYPVLYERQDVPWRTSEILGEVDDGNCYHALGGVSGHAGIFSTVPDLLRLGRSLATAGDHGELWRPDVTATLFAEGPDAGQALGWRTQPVDLDGVTRTMLWHPGFTGCALGFVPGTGLAVAMLSNRLMSGSPLPTATLWGTALARLGLSPATDEGNLP
ncbi:MAG TPA: serine hydrolase domain-containing protein [Propionibacteriaceae bacterium]|nr:serine hydrolase domain-containing protein [Propionibacteriaceae bacterium]